jgi:hypothetical protein
MSIAIFQEITTEEYLLEIEAEGKKYEGIYVDMANAPERKFVKDQAANIKAMLKRLDSERIAKSRDYRVTVEKEAATIKERLEVANSPYTLLIDSYAADCKKVRDEAKAIEDAKALAIQIKSEHEYALLIDHKVMADKEAAIQAQKDRDKLIASEAASAAIKREKSAQAHKEATAKREQELRESDVAHKTKVNNAILLALLEVPHMEDCTAKAIIKAIYNNRIPNVSIRY